VAQISCERVRWQTAVVGAEDSLWTRIHQQQAAAAVLYEHRPQFVRGLGMLEKRWVLDFVITD